MRSEVFKEISYFWTGTDFDEGNFWIWTNWTFFTFLEAELTEDVSAVTEIKSCGFILDELHRANIAMNPTHFSRLVWDFLRWIFDFPKKYPTVKFFWKKFLSLFFLGKFILFWNLKKFVGSWVFPDCSTKLYPRFYAFNGRSSNINYK